MSRLLQALKSNMKQLTAVTIIWWLWLRGWRYISVWQNSLPCTLLSAVKLATCPKYQQVSKLFLLHSKQRNSVFQVNYRTTPKASTCTG